MYHPKKIVIIGGNAAGPAAAAKAKRVNPQADVTMFEAGNFISTGTCEMPYLLSGEINHYNELIFYSPERFFDEKGVKVFINHSAKKIDTKIKVIDVVDNDNRTIEIEYDKLILATGSIANSLSDLPFSLDNVFSYKSLNDYQCVSNYLKQNSVEKILIIGSGYIGLEISDALNNAGFEVMLLEKEELPMPSADIEVQHLLKDLIDSSKLNFITASASTKFITNNNKFIQLRHEGRFRDFDMAIVSVGVTPNNFLAKDAGLKLGHSGGLIVDNRLRTSNSDIYAAGDNIEVINKITRRSDYFPLATYAHHYGHIAGENSAGGNKIANPVILNSAFKFAGKYISQVGLTHYQAKNHSVFARYVTAVANNKVQVMPNSSKVFGKLVYDEQTKLILGASFVGDMEISGYSDIISTMIFNKIPAENLSKINYNYTPPLSPFINLLSVLGRKISETK